MRKFRVEVANNENWERRHRVIVVKATTLKGAFKRARKKMRAGEMVYQVMTRIRGCELPQPIWDFFNQDRTAYWGLKL